MEHASKIAGLGAPKGRSVTNAKDAPPTYVLKEEGGGIEPLATYCFICHEASFD